MPCVETLNGTRTAQRDREVVLRPRSDIQEFDDHFTITMELPGIPADKVELEIEKNHLRVSAERKHDGETERTIHGERRYGTLSRLFHLGDVINRDGITAKTADGILTIHLPKSAQALPRKIEVGS